MIPRIEDWLSTECGNIFKWNEIYRIRKPLFGPENEIELAISGRHVGTRGGTALRITIRKGDLTQPLKPLIRII